MYKFFFRVISSVKIISAVNMYLLPLRQQLIYRLSSNGLRDINNAKLTIGVNRHADTWAWKFPPIDGISNSKTQLSQSVPVVATNALQILLFWGREPPRKSLRRRLGSLQVWGGISASVPLAPAGIICWPQAISWCWNMVRSEME